MIVNCGSFWHFIEFSLFLNSVVIPGKIAETFTYSKSVIIASKILYESAISGPSINHYKLGALIKFCSGDQIIGAIKTFGKIFNAEMYSTKYNISTIQSKNLLYICSIFAQCILSFISHIKFSKLLNNSKITSVQFFSISYLTADLYLALK